MNPEAKFRKWVLEQRDYNLSGNTVGEKSEVGKGLFDAEGPAIR